MARRCTAILANRDLGSCPKSTRPMASNQSTPSQRASLEPAYILGDRKNIPEAQNAVESVLRTELLELIPKSISESCMRHGYCTAELIVWYMMKQLIMPHDINEVTMQKEILTHPKIPPSTLDQGCVWLEEMQHSARVSLLSHKRFFSGIFWGINFYFASGIFLDLRWLRSQCCVFLTSVSFHVG